MMLHAHAESPPRARAPDHPYNLHKALTRFEQGHIRNILELTGWNLSETARMLGVSESTLRRKIRKYQLNAHA